jgi:hypothetical protein
MNLRRCTGSPYDQGSHTTTLVRGTLLCIATELIADWQQRVIFDPRGRSDTSLFVRFAPKATFTNQDVIRRFVPFAS